MLRQRQSKFKRAKTARNLLNLQHTHTQRHTHGHRRINTCATVRHSLSCCRCCRCCCCWARSWQSRRVCCCCRKTSQTTHAHKGRQAGGSLTTHTHMLMYTRAHTHSHWRMQSKSKSSSGETRQVETRDAASRDKQTRILTAVRRIPYATAREPTSTAVNLRAQQNYTRSSYATQSR